MIQFDTHLHSCYSTDSDTPIVAQIEKAINLGLSGICLTDHMDYNFPRDQFECDETTIPFEFDLSSYEKECLTLKEHYDNFEFLIGVECGLQTLDTVITKNNALCNISNLDYIIGSLHLVNRKDPYYPDFWQNMSKKQALQNYFDELYDNLQAFSKFDSLGHIDYIVRYAPQPFSYVPCDYKEILNAILAFLIEHDIALEINTSGLKSTSHTNPHIDILKQYKALGGTAVTIGSDAHTPEYIGYEFSKVEELLKNCGFNEYYIFKKRKPHAISL